MLGNGSVVQRVGTRRLAHGVLLGYLVAAAAMVTLALVTGGRPPLPAFLVAMALMMTAHALLLPNFNTIALTPMGAIAGTAASVTGAAQIAVGASLGMLLDRAFDGTILPLSLGFLGYGLVAFALVLWAERGRLFRPLVIPAPDAPERYAEPEIT
jgi:DHA1 family bicyclomycin/chloramphenicol resistance-like MFS transporter